MDLSKLLELRSFPEKADLSAGDLAKLVLKYKGLLKERGRDRAFWEATNDNLKIAYEKLDEKERELARAYGIIQDDLAVAKSIQQSLLPDLSDVMAAEIDLAVHHQQLTEVGGDYYDFFRTQGGGFAIGVFDISGHGVSAALVMTYLKAQFMQAMARLVSPKEIVEWVNKVSYRFLAKNKKYATVNFVVFESNILRYVCGGGFGLLLHKGKNQFFQKKDNFLGLREKPFHEYELPFEKGDTLVLYTDGMVESQDGSGRDYSVKRLNGLIVNNSERPVSEILATCVTDYTQFRQGDTDDITLLIIRKKV